MSFIVSHHLLPQLSSLSIKTKQIRNVRFFEDYCQYRNKKCWSWCLKYWRMWAVLVYNYKAEKKEKDNPLSGFLPPWCVSYYMKMTQHTDLKEAATCFLSVIKYTLQFCSAASHHQGSSPHHQDWFQFILLHCHFLFPLLSSPTC